MNATAAGGEGQRGSKLKKKKGTCFPATTLKIPRVCRHYETFDIVICVFRAGARLLTDPQRSLDRRNLVTQDDPGPRVSRVQSRVAPMAGTE